MQKVIATIVLLSIAILLGGCQTLARDEQQQIRKYSRISDINRRMFAEDVDAYLLLDKPSSLTQWVVHRD